MWGALWFLHVHTHTREQWNILLTHSLTHSLTRSLSNYISVPGHENVVRA